MAGVAAPPFQEPRGVPKSPPTTTPRATVDAAHRLTEELLQGYDVAVPPMPSLHDHVNVTLSLKLTKMLGMNPKERTITLAGWMREFWYDPRLDYDKSRLGGGFDAKEDYLTISHSKIWTPDIELVNSVDFNKGELCEKVDPFVYASGSQKVAASDILDLTRDTHEQPHRAQPYNVMVVRRCVMKTRCDIDFAFYPFDTQECPLIFQPWSDNFVKTYIAAEGVTSKVNLPEFNVRMHSALTDMTMIRTAAAAWPQIVINVEIARHGQYYVVNIICPALLLVLVTWFTLWIPFDKSDRLAYMVTLLFTGLFMQADHANKRPATDNETWLDDFATIITLLLVLGVLYTVWILRLRPPKKPDGRLWTQRDIERRHTKVEQLERFSRIAFPLLVALLIGSLFLDLELYERLGPRTERNFDCRATKMVLSLIVATVLLQGAAIVLSMYNMGPEMRAALEGRAVSLEEQRQQRIVEARHSQEQARSREKLVTARDELEKARSRARMEDSPLPPQLGLFSMPRSPRGPPGQDQLPDPSAQAQVTQSGLINMLRQGSPRASPRDPAATLAPPARQREPSPLPGGSASSALLQTLSPRGPRYSPVPVGRDPSPRPNASPRAEIECGPGMRQDL